MERSPRPANKKPGEDIGDALEIADNLSYLGCKFNSRPVPCLSAGLLVIQLPSIAPKSRVLAGVVAQSSSQLNIFFLLHHLAQLPPANALTRRGVQCTGKDRQDVLGLMETGLYQPHATSSYPELLGAARQDQHSFALQVFRASLLQTSSNGV